MANPGAARHGRVWQGSARQGVARTATAGLPWDGSTPSCRLPFGHEARHGWARQGRVRFGSVRQGKETSSWCAGRFDPSRWSALRGMRQGMAWHGCARPGRAWCGMAWCGNRFLVDSVGFDSLQRSGPFSGAPGWAGLGLAWHGAAGSGKETTSWCGTGFDSPSSSGSLGSSWHGTVRQGRARTGSVWLGLARQSKGPRSGGATTSSRKTTVLIRVHPPVAVLQQLLASAAGISGFHRGVVPSLQPALRTKSRPPWVLQQGVFDFLACRLPWGAPPGHHQNCGPRPSR